MTILLALLSRLGGVIAAIWPYLLCAAIGAYGWQHFIVTPKLNDLHAALQADADSAKQFERDVRAITAKNEVEMQRTKENYDAALKRQADDLAAARDTGNRLRDAVAIYAGLGQGLPSTEDPAVLRDRLKALGLLYGDMAAVGDRLTREADAVNDALRACEATVAP